MLKIDENPMHWVARTMFYITCLNVMDLMMKAITLFIVVRYKTLNRFKCKAQTVTLTTVPVIGHILNITDV